jgi:hypothetical protein
MRMIFVTLLGLPPPVPVEAAAVIVAAAAALAAAIVAVAAEESCVPLLPRKAMNTAVLVWDTIVVLVAVGVGLILVGVCPALTRKVVKVVLIALGDHGNTEWLVDGDDFRMTGTWE